MPLSIKRITFWVWAASIFFLIVYLFINFHTPQGMWVGLQPRFFGQVSKCISDDEKGQDIKNLNLWINRLENRVPIKNAMYDETKENLKRMKITTDADKSNIEIAISKNEDFRQIEIDFLKDAVNFNVKKINSFIILDSASYCFKKNKVKWKMSIYRRSLTYLARNFFLNENENYWNQKFLIKFGKPIF